MAVENSRIVAGHSIPRGDAGGSNFFYHSADPTQVSSYQRFKDNGELEDVSTSPRLHGEMWFYRDSAGTVFTYVAIDIGGTLQWVPLKLFQRARSKFNGETWDPLTDR